MTRMLTPKEQRLAQTEALVIQVKERARHLYESRQFLCTEAVVVAMNQDLGGGLTEDQALAVAAPFSFALGGSGCFCGALSGAVLASGLLLGKDRPYGHRKEMRETARQLHDVFKSSHGATCCRVLSRKVRQNKKAHFQQCAGLTAEATEQAVRLVLKKRPELISIAGSGSLEKQPSQMGCLILRLVNYFKKGKLLHEQDDRCKGPVLSRAGSDGQRGR